MRSFFKLIGLMALVVISSESSAVSVNIVDDIFLDHEASPVDIEGLNLESTNYLRLLHAGVISVAQKKALIAVMPIGDDKNTKKERLRAEILSIQDAVNYCLNDFQKECFGNYYNGLLDSVHLSLNNL